MTLTPQNGRRLLALCLIFNLVAPSFATWPWGHTQQASWDTTTTSITEVTYVNAAGEPCPEPVSFVRYQEPCEPDTVVVTQEEPCSPPVVNKPRPSPKPSPCSPPVVNKPRPSPKPSPKPPAPKAPRSPRKPRAPLSPPSPNKPRKPRAPLSPPSPNKPRKPRAPLSPPSPCVPSPPRQPRRPASPPKPLSPKAPRQPRRPASPPSPLKPKQPRRPASPPKPLSPKAPRQPRKPTSPYPPSPLTPVGIPGGFPYCECTSGVPNPYITTVSSSAGGKYCWTVTANRPSSGSACGNFDLRKVEVEINPVCKASVQAITFNGQKFFPSFTTYPLPGKPTVLKVTRGSDTLTSYVGLRAQSVQMCITLSGACPTLATLCKSPSCAAAFFNPSKSCCPIASLI